jgi:hypothetical protein
MARPEPPTDGKPLHRRRLLLATALGLAGCGRRPEALKAPEEPKPEQARPAQPEQEAAP